MIGYHPTPWRSATAVLIKKARKPEYPSPKAYRIICLLSCTVKLLERVIARRLAFTGTKHGLLAPSQFSGRPGRSALDAAAMLESFVRDSLSRNRRRSPSRLTVSAVTMDIQAAFDRVDKAYLDLSLLRMGYPAHLRRWVDSFLFDRRISFSFNGKTDQPRHAGRGVPQGSPFSPILCLPYASALRASPNGEPRFTLDKRISGLQLSYVDDFCVAVSSPSGGAKAIRENSEALYRVTSQLTEQAVRIGLTFDPSKTELIHFSRRRAPTEETVPLPGGVVAHPADAVRYLGFFIDRKLDWQQHVQHRANLASAVLSSLARLKTIQQATTVRPVSKYGPELWCTSSGRIVKILRMIPILFASISPASALQIER